MIFFKWVQTDEIRYPGVFEFADYDSVDEIEIFGFKMFRIKRLISGDDLKKKRGQMDEI